MDLFTEFAMDKSLSLEGRWVPFNDKTSFKIARAYNKNFALTFQRLYKANRLALEAKGEKAEALSAEILAESMAEAILLDWQGPVKLKGEDLGAYTKQAAKKALMLVEFREWVQKAAEEDDAYRVAQAEQDAKN